MKRRASSRGVVLLALMVLLALLGAAAAGFAESATTAAQREREAQLLWIGRQFSQALESYYWASPGPVKHLPTRLDDLLRDPRFPQPVRHLRQLYADPLQPEVPWALLRRGNQIVGVHSQSDATPLRRRGFGTGLESFELAEHYSDWRFVFIPRAATAATPSPSTARPTPASP